MLPKVKVVRNENRKGLISSRVIGADNCGDSEISSPS